MPPRGSFLKLNSSSKQARAKDKPKIKLPSLKKTLYVIFILGLCLTIYLFLNSQFFKINQIECLSNNKPCEQEIIDQTNRYLNQNSLFLKPSEIQTELKESNTLIDAAEITLTFPHKLTIKVNLSTTLYDINLLGAEYDFDLGSPEASMTATPSASLKYQQLKQFTLNQPKEKLSLAKNGSLISSKSESETKNYAFLTNNLEKNLENLFKFLHELNLSGIFYQLLVLKDDVIYVYTSDYTLLVNTADDPRQTINTLQRIRASSTIDLSNAIIDLRFNKPVIKN